MIYIGFLGMNFTNIISSKFLTGQPLGKEWYDSLFILRFKKDQFEIDCRCVCDMCGIKIKKGENWNVVECMQLI
jgi:hypothetical protein